MIKINFTSDQYVFALGRNGTMYCKGLEIITWQKNPFMDNSIRIYPLNTKGSCSSCYIDIPRSEIPNLIIELQKLVQG